MGQKTWKVKNQKRFLNAILDLLPEGEQFYPGDEISDLQTKFFVGELIREKIYELFKEEIPYQSTVAITEYKEKETLVKIVDTIQELKLKGINLKNWQNLFWNVHSNIRKSADRETLANLF